MAKTTNSGNTAPSNACVFAEQGAVQFTQSDGDDKANGFSIVGYSGGIIKNHWYWGNLAFDLSGTKFAKSPTPILEEHFTSARLGFTTKQEIADKVTVEGTFLDNDTAGQMAADIRAGFPMEASLYIQPSVVERVDEGASVKVNGHVLKGPGRVFRKAVIKEVSMCVFGADSNTKSLASAAGDDGQIKFNFTNKETHLMAEQENSEHLVIEGLTADKFAEACPGIHKTIVAAGRAEGIKAGQARFAELKEACGDDFELLAECFSQGKSVTEALKAANAKLTEANAKLAKQVKTPKSPDDLAKQEFSDDENSQDHTQEADSGDEEGLKAEFAESADLQSEFGRNVKAYLAFKKAEAEGKVGVAGRN